jgi:hypothetical protein
MDMLSLLLVHVHDFRLNDRLPVTSHLTARNLFSIIFTSRLVSTTLFVSDQPGTLVLLTSQPQPCLVANNARYLL